MGRELVRDLTSAEYLSELESVAADALNQHLSRTVNWYPHDYVPWDQGTDFAALGGQDWDPEQSQLSELAKAAMITNLLTEDNLPSYHREAMTHLTLDSAWGTWVNRWTAEENRHGIAIRDYLVVSRGVDPVALEQARMEHVANGFAPTTQEEEAIATHVLMAIVYPTFQELATRVSHRNTGKVCDDPVADRLLKRISADENLHMIFYRQLSAAALELSPDQTLHSIAAVIENFRMPGTGMPNFRRHGVLMAKHGIYDPRQHLEEVVLPPLRQWKIFDRTDFTARGEQRREELAAYLEKMEQQAVRFEEQRDRLLAREASRQEECTAAKVG